MKRFTAGLDTAYSQKSPDTIAMLFQGNNFNFLVAVYEIVQAAMLAFILSQLCYSCLIGVVYKDIQSIRSWLNVRAADPTYIDITETLDYEGNAIKNRIFKCAISDV